MKKRRAFVFTPVFAIGWVSALLAVTLIAVALGWVYLILTLWALRDRFEIAVR